MKTAFISKVLLAIVFTVSISTNSAFAATKINTNNNTQKVQVTKNKPAPPAPIVDAKITVLDGQNLSDLATSNNTTMLRMYYANIQISDPNLIYPGEILTVPNANEVLKTRDLPQQIVPVADVSQPTPIQSKTSTPISVTVVSANTTNGNVWNEIASCESGGNWGINTGNGFYGGLQFTLSSWHAVGGSGYPNQASASEQIARAQILQSRQGWGAWPACSAKLGL